MPSGEKKVAAILGLILVALVTLYLTTKPKAGESSLGPQLAGGPDCAPAGGGGAAETQVLGKPGAKLEIIAVLPISHGCHAATEAELKKAYEAHPDDIYLTIVDLMGPDAAQYREKVGVAWTVVSINGQSTFQLNGRSITIEQMEHRTYRPSDILPIVDAELEKLS
jgi:hypothetical protein